VVDISHINYVSLSPDMSTATVGAGARLGAVYSVLGQQGRTWIAGICPSVGIGGYFTCGGYNMQMRAYGMAVDWVVSAKVVLATGEMVTVSPTEHPDLWFAMRGGGIFAFTVEATLKTAIIPRSAMLYMEFNSKATRLESTQKYLDWAPKQDPLFNSQLNLWNNRTMVLGWYVGKSVPELTAIVKTSGLMDIPGAVVKISGNCSTENSRNFWLYSQQTCTDDATAHAAFDTWFNVIPDDILPPMGATPYSFNDVPAIPNETQANLFPRIALINKTYFTIKSSPLSEADIAYIVQKSGELPDEAGFWTEMTSFNISAPKTTSAFPWQDEATALFRFQVMKTGNATVDAVGRSFMNDLDSYLIPRIGYVFLLLSFLLLFPPASFLSSLPLRTLHRRELIDLWQKCNLRRLHRRAHLHQPVDILLRLQRLQARRYQEAIRPDELLRQSIHNSPDGATGCDVLDG